MPVPNAPFFKPAPKLDLLDQWINLPRRAVKALAAEGRRRGTRKLIIEYSAIEADMLVRAYGCTSYNPTTAQQFRELLASYGAGETWWKDPTDIGGTIQLIVLPLANLLNLAVGVEDDKAWEAGVEVLSTVNPKLCDWFTFRACQAPGIEGSRIDPGLVELVFSDWAARTASEQYFAVERISYRSDLRSRLTEYESVLDGSPQLDRDRSAAEQMEAFSRVFSRDLILRYDAVALGPGNIYDASDNEMRDSMEERRAERETQTATMIFAAGIAAAQWSRAASAAIDLFGAFQLLRASGLNTSDQNNAANEAASSRQTEQTRSEPTSNELYQAANEGRSEAQRRQEAERQEVISERNRTARVAPLWAQVGGEGLSPEEIEAEAALRLNWNATYLPVDPSGYSIEQFVQEAILRNLALINFLPEYLTRDEDADRDPSRFLAQFQAHIDSLTNPGHTIIN